MDRILYQLTVITAGTCLGVAAFSMMFSADKVAQVPSSTLSTGQIPVEMVKN
jgi:hypothetical protein